MGPYSEINDAYISSMTSYIFMATVYAILLALLLVESWDCLKLSCTRIGGP